MSVKLLTEHNLGFLSLKGGCTGSSESTLVKMLNCWKSSAAAQIVFFGVRLDVCLFDKKWVKIKTVYLGEINNNWSSLPNWSPA